MSHKHIMEAIIAGVAVYVIVNWIEKNKAQTATAASFLPGSLSQPSGVMA